MPSLKDTLIQADKKQKAYFLSTVSKYDIRLKHFNFLDDTFNENFSNYKQELNDLMYKDAPREKDGSYLENFYCNRLIENYSLIHHQLPDFYKEFIIKFVNTPFFRAEYEARKYDYPDSPDYVFVDIDTDGSGIDSDACILRRLMHTATIGLIPRYKSDSLKAIRIDFDNKTADIATGFATGYYASKVIKSIRPPQRYMQPILNKLFKDYDKWKEENDFE